ncbi:hypothetical protein LJ655_04595 [Paraburkholderia sp. MMS20-SJTN17]|uniref:Uncharacterized protein n=1 Tax=Paraburkholderia translucens TaxID=2886945 RepID=A0ABS8K8U9_9BURK|nr:hypothetical protein [Paraburkholderia sp. MMS20-SJTN17]MCC8401180.1 hypothetical protein [Paraburkholderia sp. MMS20-SJTN17]
MSVMVHVEYQYCQHGKRAVLTGSESLTVEENTPRAVLSLLRLLHPQWEGIKVLSVTEAAPEGTAP